MKRASTTSSKSSAKTRAVQKSAGARQFGEMLFEIGCEEIPAGMVARACDELQAILSKRLIEGGLAPEVSSGSLVDVFGAPRRLVAIAKQVRLRQEDVTREIVGPPKSVAFDNVGEPTRAAMSLRRKTRRADFAIDFREHSARRVPGDQAGSAGR